MRTTLLRLLLVLGLLLAYPSQAQTSLYFPPSPAGGAWATTSPQSLGWCQPQLDSLLNFLGRRNTKSFLVLKDGRLVVERYYGTYTADSAWYWASAGKSLTAVLIGLAQQEGLLRLSDSTSRTLGRGWSSAPAAKERLITVRHQLTMTTGLTDTPPLPCDNESTAAACLTYRADAGTRWAYHTGPYRLLQDVVARASGLTLNQYSTQKLTSRLGMNGLWVNDVYYSRARDMARFGLFILARGQWNGTGILTDTTYFRQMTTPSQAFNRSYGYLWWLNGQPSHKLPGPQQTTFQGPIIPTAPADLIAALGKNDQKIYVVPSLGLVVVRQGKDAGNPTLALSSFDADLWRYFMAVLQCRTLAAKTAVPSSAWQVYPNPATGVAHVTLPAATPAGSQLRVVDVMGREQLKQPATGGTTTVSLPGLAPGMYVVQWLNKAGYLLSTKRLVLAK
ncbi:serine hydrolase [Hymenobacter wooponensis]|uniref:T9SS type A sorting domain-containing protein n=1 Tax=Hymenobacter wooponensis TaxID=1525360 RepID=A0A4Z0MUS3_9BACT|nr:serine hydrolase [Hymenobacter wooponensis]TGD83220.1 T9SS type A sorting domain-containing protein [Hymenobacter wooponensis]